MQAVFTVLLPFAVCAQSTAFNDKIDRADPNFVKASLIVVDPGEIMYSCFGHAVIRLECPKRQLDYFFTYESEPILENKWRFFWGDLKMVMFAVPSEKFLVPYEQEKRGVRQYALDLPPAAKLRLWEILDRKVSEGLKVPYDQVERCCAQCAFRHIKSSLEGFPVRYSTWPDGFEGTKTRREVARDFIKHLPWTSFVMSAISGSVLDEQCSAGEKIIIPDDLVAVLKGATVGGRPIISGEPGQLLPAHPLKTPSWLTPMLLAMTVLILSGVNLFVDSAVLDYGLLCVYGVFGLAFFLLVCISSLPTNGWNWMILPFNVLPVVLWKWRKSWGPFFAGFLTAFAIVVSVLPHRITEWPYVVFIVAFALLFARTALRRMMLFRGGKRE